MLFATAAGRNSTASLLNSAGISCLLVWVATPAIADEAAYGLAINKLEHLFSSHVSLFEVEATYGNANGSIGLKSESEYVSGTYNASENQLYVSKSISDRVSGFLGIRYLDWREDGDTSAMFGVSAAAPFDIDIVVSAFLDGGRQLEGRVEFERPTSFTPRTEMQPKIELRTLGGDVESVSVELRLAYATTDRLQSYVGFSWLRPVGTAADQNELTALAGLSFEW